MCRDSFHKKNQLLDIDFEITVFDPNKYSDFPTALIVGTIFIISFGRRLLAYIGVGNHND